jgi:hypothetical protein
MTIKSKDELEDRPLEIDLTGPDGNAFVLMGTAKRLADQLLYDEIDINDMICDMKSSDYDNLVNVFDKHFGDYVTLYR